MKSIRKILPWAMRAVFQDLHLITYAVEPARLAAALPPGIHPTIHSGCAFVSIVVASMRGMRPGFVPALLGSNAYQVVYRSVVHLRLRDGGIRHGVFFLRSDCNDPLLSFLGNMLTEFRFHFFHSSSIGLYERHEQSLISVQTRDGAGDLVLVTRDQGRMTDHPPCSLFPSVSAENAALVELFHAFSYDPASRAINDMQIERRDWHARRVAITDAFSSFFADTSALPGNLISALAIRECEYVWQPMKTVPLSELA